MSAPVPATSPVRKIAFRQIVFRTILRDALCKTGLALGLFALLIVLFGCEGARKPEPPDARWSAYIAAHTSGPISRQSAVRIVFTRDVAGSRVGASLDDALLIEPRIEGEAKFESARVLVFKPKSGFKPGESYRFALRPRDLLDVPKNLPSYRFVVEVQRPQFDLRFEGLSSRLDSDAMMLRGEIVTADEESAAQVEQVLSAASEDRSLQIDWQHPNARSHLFAISVRRTDREQAITVSWSGRSIGAATQGKREFSVPTLHTFALSQVDVVGDAADAERHLIALFTDALDAQQDLRGLVRVISAQGEIDARLRVEGNALHIYVNDTVSAEARISFDGAIRNARGRTLGSTQTQTVAFPSAAPQLRFVGNGAILPNTAAGAPLTIPFEAVNLRSVRVTAFRVYESNLAQFLQVNNLDGNRELDRVGSHLWRKTIHLTPTDLSPGRWKRYALDVGELMSKHHGDLLRLTLSFGKDDISNGCGGARDAEDPPADVESADMADATVWDYVQYEYDGERVDWQERDDPCKAAYYYYGKNVRAARNFIVSNFGLLAKRDRQGALLVAVTDLRSAEPLSGVKVTLLSYQNQAIGTMNTAADGIARLATKVAPALLIAEKDGKRGYLRLAPGVALPTSHFDVGGEDVAAGIKATLYGERGVWRPGDAIHLTFVVQDPSRSLPDNHPVTLELFSPQRQLVHTVVNDKPVGGFYAFALKTADNAPTGDWLAKATIGGNTFTKTLKIETVMPNRLKIDLNMEALDATAPLKGELQAQWLTGATAANLHADVKMKLVKRATSFANYADFDFDDPARDFVSEARTIFDGELDAQGRAKFDKELDLEQAPGMLQAALIARVFERGGAFSIHRQTATVSPYTRYVGVKLPRTDQWGDALVNDRSHDIDIVSVDARGKPVDIDDLAIRIYRIDWRWWWDQSGESLASFINQQHARVHEEGTVKTVNGAARWVFTPKLYDAGRYLLRVCDSGGHCAGRAFYVSWPHAGHPETDTRGATMLAVAADKPAYQVGDIAHIDLPQHTEGRALITLENGSRVLSNHWVAVRDGNRRIAIPVTAAMAPNVYVSVELLQPHAKRNDRPLRMFGIVPLTVSDPQTHLHPVLDVANEWRPEANVAIEVSERERRAMHYTLAIVDEGLLGLTNFKTPRLHEQFYKREALGVSTWDVFDEVIGGYGAELERLLALGGSDATQVEGEKNTSRFPPVVKFLGPFTLSAGARAKHEVRLPQYVGAVRVMLIAGERGAYGSTDATVPVRQPLMILPTLPRVIGPEEEIAVPISVFANDASIESVAVGIEVDEHFEILGRDTAHVKFTEPQEKLAVLRVKSRPRMGRARVAFRAVGGAHTARTEIHIEVRSPNPPSVEVTQQVLKPGEVWATQFKPHGLHGTNAVTLEVSSVMPLGLEKRLDYLIQYPYGCVEQTTSSAFPQLSIPKLMQLDERRKREVETNVRAAIERLQDFQHANGGFAYWPGGWTYAGGVDPRYAWASTYVGHFLVEAERAGYRVPASMLNNWLRFQRHAAQSWVQNMHANSLDQAYRLYTLALANRPEVGAMNRLRDAQLPVAARWMLAATYKLAGLRDAADSLLKENAEMAGAALKEYPFPDHTFGSRLRDAAIVLDAAVQLEKGATKSLIDAIAADLNGGAWYSTQSVAYALLAMSKAIGNAEVGPFEFEYGVNGKFARVSGHKPVSRVELQSFPDTGAELVVKNTSARTLFASAIVRGVPRSGNDNAASSGLSVDVRYTDSEGNSLDVRKLASGTDLIAHVSVRNTQVFAIENIALTQLTPSGWEIHNDRMDGVAAAERTRDRWYWRYANESRKPEYVDIRDDRILSFFALNPGERIDFITHVNAAYVGRFYLPSIAVEAMYDASKHARTKGEWVEVVGR